MGAAPDRWRIVVVRTEALRVLPLAGLLASGVTAAPALVERPSAAPVTVDLRGATIQEAVEELSSASGFPIRPGNNLPPIRIFLVAQNRPLPEVIARLKETVHYPPGQIFWFRSGSGSIFDEDLASGRARRDWIKKVRQLKLREARKQAREVREWARAPVTAQEPAHAIYDKRKLTIIYEFFDSLPGRVQEDILVGLARRIPFAGLTPRQKQLILALDGSGDLAGERKKKILKAAEASYAMSFFPYTNVDPEQPAMQVVLQTTASGGAGEPDLLMKPHYNKTGDKVYRYRYTTQQPRSIRRGPRDMEKIPPLQRLTDFFPKSDLDKTAHHIFPAIAKAGGMPLIGDYDPCAYGGAFGTRSPRWVNWITPKSQKVRVWEAMEEACQQLDLFWDYRNGWLRVRSERAPYGWAGLMDLSPLRD